MGIWELMVDHFSGRNECSFRLLEPLWTLLVLVILGYSWPPQGQLEASHTCLLDQTVVLALILYHKRYRCQELKHCFVTHPVLIVIVMSVQTG